VTEQCVRFRRGDLVEVKTPNEIMETLDAEGASGHLPFMPEMLQFCGRRFRVATQASTICFSGPGPFRAFGVNDIVTLEGVRCSGSAHGNCQKACMVFWRAAWVRKVEDSSIESQVELRDLDRLRARLKVSTSPELYYCQATELSKATHPMSRSERLGKYFGGLRAGNFNALEMATSTGRWFFWKIRQMFLALHVRESKQSTPAESLNLGPGDWVEVKSLQSIMETLDARGRNRGLYFSPDMRLWCGRRCRVKGRLDRIIVDGTGQMRQLRNTVCLEGSTCGCSYVGFGMSGCSRCELTYWREIWLRRLDENGKPLAP